MMISQRTRNLQENQARDYNTPQLHLGLDGRLGAHSHDVIGVPLQVNSLIAEGKLKGRFRCEGS